MTLPEGFFTNFLSKSNLHVLVPSFGNSFYWGCQSCLCQEEKTQKPLEKLSVSQNSQNNS